MSCTPVVLSTAFSGRQLGDFLICLKGEVSLTKIILTCNSFAHSQNNKADTKHPQYLSMILVFLCEIPISRRASGACKSEKNEML